MFRFVNSGLKQSISTLPNSVYHCPNLHKKGTDDDNENKKLALMSLSKFEQTIGFYRNFPNQNKFNFDKRNLVLELSFDFDLNKPFHSKQINSHINDCLINFQPYCANKSIYGNRKMLKSINEHPNGFSNNKIKSPNHILKEIENKPDFFLLNSNKLNIEQENRNLINNKQTQTAVNDEKSSLNKPVKFNQEIIKENNEKIQIEKSQTDLKIDHLNILGHELNTKGCEAAKLLDHSTALQFWNCAAAFNYPPSQFNLGVYYQSIKDLVTAEKWYRLAVEYGEHPVAAYNLALLLNNKLDDKLKDEIKDLLIISANQGSKEAQNCIECIKNSS